MKNQRNWPKYNQSLKNRARLNFFVDVKAVEQSWLSLMKGCGQGRPEIYSDYAITICLTLKAVFGLALRQCEGFVESLFKTLQLNLDVPNYTLLSRRASCVDVKKVMGAAYRGHCECIVLDGTGLKMAGEGEWKVRTHGKGNRRQWVKLTISVDPTVQTITDFELSDAYSDEVQSALKIIDRAGTGLHTVIGDGSYDSDSVYQKGYREGFRVITPPCKNAVSSDLEVKPHRKDRNEAISRIASTPDGRKEWKQEVNYHRRSLVETAFFRLKNIFGGQVCAKRRENQISEVAIKLGILNKWTMIDNAIYAVS